MAAFDAYRLEQTVYYNVEESQKLWDSICNDKFLKQFVPNYKNPRYEQVQGNLPYYPGYIRPEVSNRIISPPKIYDPEELRKAKETYADGKTVYNVNKLYDENEEEENDPRDPNKKHTHILHGIKCLSKTQN